MFSFLTNRNYQKSRLRLSAGYLNPMSDYRDIADSTSPSPLQYSNMARLSLITLLVLALSGVTFAAPRALSALGARGNQEFTDCGTCRFLGLRT